MQRRKSLAIAGLALSSFAFSLVPQTSAHAADGWCGAGWQAVTSYRGPASGSFTHMSTRTCITKAMTGEYFSGSATVFNGATTNGQYNGHNGSRWVQFGSAGGNAMIGAKLGYGDATKVIKGSYGDPTNNCYAGEIMPGYQVTCTSDWVLDNTPLSANRISSYVLVGAYFWQSGMGEWQWADGSAVRDSSFLN
ncbi:hypothetical protein [Streptomyces sp. NPDC058412]|uniref:hypothetical protein n=2 Tax=unclassified Streptomyces TaxID=2593676 RepID=UPI00364C32A0